MYGLKTQFTASMKASKALVNPKGITTNLNHHIGMEITFRYVLFSNANLMMVSSEVY